MHNNYKIQGAIHNTDNSKSYLNDPNYFTQFQEGLIIFKELVIKLVENNESKSFVHFGDGDYFFLKKMAIGSATPGKRALSIPYNRFDIMPFKHGWMKADYHCVEYLELDMRQKLNELYPNQITIPTEYLYGLTMNRWFFKQFKGKIGLIGAGTKLNVIKELMKYKEYQEYLDLDNFNDYIEIPERFACDNIQNTIELVKIQLEKANPETRVYLYGVGHVKSALIHHLPKFKSAIYLDIGGGIDAIAGLIDPDRPYAGSWINHRMKNYDYNNIDLLNYNKNSDCNLKILI